MEICTCLVNQTDVAGVVLNQVRKEAATAAEVVLLRDIHGFHKVVDIVKVAEMPEHSDREERGRLAALYGPEKVSRVFGASPYGPLPHTVPMPQAEAGLSETSEMDVEIAHAATRKLEAAVKPALPVEPPRPAAVVPDMKVALLTVPRSPLAATDED